MNQIKTGKLIRNMRTEKSLTQKQLAEILNVSEKTISKWETGKGYPDISIFTELAEVFQTDIQTLLSGKINYNESEKGNMKKVKFYVCSECGNIITSTSDTNVSCCGKKLETLEMKKADESEKLSVEKIDGELYISSDHQMTKEHYISFVACVNESTIIMQKQYPEWNLQLRMPEQKNSKLIWYCTKCGLYFQNI